MTPTSQRVRILHTNDIHGRIEGLARIATLVKREREANPDLPILYLDGGDVEESSVRLSNLTRGVGMHRLLNVAGCDAATIGNGGMLRYGYQVLKEYGAVSSFPQLLANYRLPDGSFPEGVHATTILHAGALSLGVIGISDNIENAYTTFFGMQELATGPLVRDLTAQLLQQRADAVILLSHMGLDADRKLAGELQGLISLIIGAHSHSLLPEGELVGDVLLAHAGDYARHLGSIDLLWDGSKISIERVQVLPVSEEVPQEPAFQVEIERIEAETAQFLSEVIGELAEPLNFSTEYECGTVDLMADMLRERMHADVALIAAGSAFTGPLPAGRLTRGQLWEACPSPANPGVVELTGEQLLYVVKRGLSPEIVEMRPRPLRGLAQGLLHLSGATFHDGMLSVGEEPVQLERIYRVAGSDWEFDSSVHYVDPAWDLRPTYHAPTLLREALEEYLAQRQEPITVARGRIVF